MDIRELPSVGVVRCNRSLPPGPRPGGWPFLILLVCPAQADIPPALSAGGARLVANIYPFFAHRYSRRGMILRLVVTRRFWLCSNRWLLTLLPFGCCTKLPTCTARCATRRHSRILSLRDGSSAPHLPPAGPRTPGKVVAMTLWGRGAPWIAGMRLPKATTVSLSTRVHRGWAYCSAVTRGV